MRQRNRAATKVHRVDLIDGLALCDLLDAAASAFGPRPDGSEDITVERDFVTQ